MIENFVAFLCILFGVAWPLLYTLAKTIVLMVSMGLPFRGAFSRVNTPEHRAGIDRIEPIVYWTAVLTCVIYAELLLVQTASTALMAGGALGLWIVMVCARTINESMTDQATRVTAAIFYVTTCALLTVQTWNLSFSLGFTLGMVVLDLLWLAAGTITERLLSRAVIRRRTPPEKAMGS